MHEMSIAQSLLDIIRQEMAKHGVTRLNRVKVVLGQMSNIVPDSLHFAFEALTLETDLQGAILETSEVPLRYRCSRCRQDFVPEEVALILAPCPACGEDFGHEVIAGRELYIESIEAE